MSLADDKYYYRIRAIQSDIEWMARTEVEARKEGRSELAGSPGRADALRKLLASVSRDVAAIQESLGKGFTPEFQDLDKIQ